MITNDEIQSVIKKLSKYNVTLNDICFIQLCKVLLDKRAAYKAVYHENIGTSEVEKYYSIKKFTRIREVLQSILPKSKDITFEENKEEMLKELDNINKREKDGDIDHKDAAKMRVAIRTTLNDKFGTQESQDNKNLIVVPAKFDYICPHTHKECYFPPKEECMKKYNLIENK